MQKQLTIVDKEKGIIQVTTLDERWYAVPVLSDEGIPVYRFLPSVSWIAGCYPKGVAFYKWLANTGWDESQQIKESAGGRGTKVHHAIHDLIKGEKILYTDKFDNGSGIEEELTVDEWKTLLSFAAWVKDAKPKFIATEKTIVSEKYGFAGTIDAVVEIDGVRYIVDWKTSKSIWTEYELQISAYRRAWVDALGEKDRKEYTGEYRSAILQVGYEKNRKGYKWTEVPDRFELFQHAQAIWRNENPDTKPKQIELPTSLDLGIEKPKKTKK